MRDHPNRSDRGHWLARLAIAWALCAGTALADDPPRVGRSNESNTPPAQRVRRAVMIDRLREALAQLDLSADQQKRIDAVLDDAAGQMAALRESGNNLETLREQAREVFLAARVKIRNELTADQEKKLNELLSARRGDMPAESAPAGDGMMDQTMTVRPPPRPTTRPSEPAPVVSPAPAPAVAPRPTPKLEIGHPAPRFLLHRLDSRPPATLASYSGKPLVLVFGSFTSPTFRDKVPLFEAMKKRYKGKANIVFVYTREAYPADEWDVQRNLDDQIVLRHASTLQERIKMAKDTRDGLKITVEMLVDDVDDGVVTTYEAFPNGAVVIDAQGRLVYKQKWADPHVLSTYVDDALRTR